MNNKYIFLLFVLLFCTSHSLFAQDQKKLEQLIKKSNSEMYENPEKVIKNEKENIELE